MRHSLSKDTAFNGETTPRHTFLCSDSQCLPPGDPRILCSKHGSPITGKSFILYRALILRTSCIVEKYGDTVGKEIKISSTEKGQDFNVKKNILRH